MYTNRNIWNVSYPIFLSLLAQNVINVTDTAFLGRVGEVELGASAMGGLYYICAFTIAFGFSTGSQIVIGRRNVSACSRRTAAATPMCRRCRRWAWISRPSRAS